MRSKLPNGKTRAAAGQNRGRKRAWHAAALPRARDSRPRACAHTSCHAYGPASFMHPSESRSPPAVRSSARVFRNNACLPVDVTPIPVPSAVPYASAAPTEATWRRRCLLLLRGCQARCPHDGGGNTQRHAKQRGPPWLSAAVRADSGRPRLADACWRRLGQVAAGGARGGAPGGRRAAAGQQRRGARPPTERRAGAVREADTRHAHQQCCFRGPLYGACGAVAAVPAARESTLGAALTGETVRARTPDARTRLKAA